MPEISDENIQKVKEQLQNIGQAVGQKARDAIGPEKAAAISAAMPGVKSAARSAAIRSLRAMQTLCAAGAEKLESGRRIEAAAPKTAPTQAAPQPEKWQEAKPQPRPHPKPKPEPRSESELPKPEPEPDHKAAPERSQPHPRPASHSYDRPEPEIIRPKSTTHARRSFTYFGVLLALVAAGAFVFSGVTIIRLLRPRLGRPEGTRSIYEPVVRAATPGGVVHVSRPASSAAPKNAAPRADAPAASVELPERVKITLGTEKGVSSVNVRDDHSTKGTKVVGKVAPGSVKLLEIWEGKDQFPWYKVEAKNVTGWVYGRYVAVPAPPKPKAAPKGQDNNAPATGNERAGRVTRNGVNVRDGHSTKNTRIVTRVSNRDVAIVDEWKESGGSYPWYKIRLDNGEGWVYGRYVEVN